MADPTTLARRRRAACAVLEGVLGDDDLLAALWLQHDSMAGDAVSDIIRYVDAVADRYLLDAGTRKRLYDGLHRALRRADADLPIDPWPAMLAVRPAPAVVAPTRAPSQPARSGAAPYAAPVAPAYPPRYPAAPNPPAYPPSYPPAYPPAYAPAYPAAAYPPAYPGAAVPQGYPTPGFPQSYPVAPVAAPQPPVPAAVPVPAPVAEPQPLATAAPLPAAAATPPADVGWTPESGVPAEQAVFAALIATIAAEIAQTHAADFDDWRSSWQALLAAQKKQLPAELHARLMAACSALAPSQDAEARRQSWLLPLAAKPLAEQVHQLYVALCEALGPVSADQVLTRAVKQVEHTPPARLFSPRKLL